MRFFSLRWALDAPLWALWGISIGLSLWVFDPLIWHPGTYLLGQYGDGGKNVFTFVWYVLHDQGNWFTGMNYPFGEHVNYPDMQPLLAWLARGARAIGLLPANGVAVLAVLHWAQAVGLATTPPVLYALLRRARVGGWFAVAAALLITFQSPQILRVAAGHMALAYPVIIPGLWLLTVRLTELPGWRRALALVLGCVAAALLSSYFLMAGLLLIGGYALVGLALARRPARPAALRAAGWLLASAAVALTATLLWLRLTDPYAADRPTDPFGFFFYITSLPGVFLPSDTPMVELWQAIFHHTLANGEGQSYVGVVPAVVLVLTAMRAAAYLLRRRHRRPGLILRPVLPTFLRTGVWVAVLTLLFAMAYPFRWNLQWLLELMPPLKQLRSLGRFAWLFYYIYTVYAACYLWQLNRLLRQRRAARFAGSLLAVLLIIWGIDALLNARRFSQKKDRYPYAAELVGQADSYLGYLMQAHRYASDFQAILPLPYFSLGSEKWGLAPVWMSDFECYRAALQTDLPLAATNMSRSALGPTRAILQLVASPLIARDQLPRLASNKPFLLLVKTGQPLRDTEQRLVRLAQPLFTNDRIALYELPVAALLADDRAQALADTARRVPLPAEAGGPAAVSGLIHPIIREGFAGNSHIGRSEPGARIEPPGDHSMVLYDGPLPGPPDTLRYETSAWVYLRTRIALPWMHVKQFNAAGDQLSDAEVDLKSLFDVQGDWLRGRLVWARRPDATRLLVYVDGDEVVADDLLVRPLPTRVWDRTRTGIMTLDGFGLTGIPGAEPSRQP